MGARLYDPTTTTTFLSPDPLTSPAGALWANNPYDYATHENPQGGLPAYFEREVIGGPGAFVEVANGYASFERVIRRKFVLELSQLRGAPAR